MLSANRIGMKLVFTLLHKIYNTREMTTGFYSVHLKITQVSKFQFFLVSKMLVGFVGFVCF